MATKKASIRCIMFDLPEEQMLKLVNVAASEGKTAHNWVAQLVTNELKARKA